MQPGGSRLSGGNSFIASFCPGAQELMPPSQPPAAPRGALRAARPVRVVISRSGFWGLTRRGGSSVVFGGLRPGNMESDPVKVAVLCARVALGLPAAQQAVPSCGPGVRPGLLKEEAVCLAQDQGLWVGCTHFSGPRFPHNDVFSCEVGFNL